MSGASSLQKGVLNLASMRSHDLQLFVDILRSARTSSGNTGLVFDRSLSGPLGLVLEMSALHEQGVSKIYHLGITSSPRGNHPSLLWVVRPDIDTTKILVSCINQCEPGVKHTVCYVPRRSLLCDQILNDDPVARNGIARITEFPLYLIPFDDDLLSMEAIDDMRATRVDGDPSELFNVASALIKLQSAYGTIPHIYGKGHYAKQLCEMLRRMRNEAASDSSSGDGDGPVSTPDDLPPEIGNLLLIDREVDMVTPMLTQLSFEGAIDELLGITNSSVELDAEVISPPPPPGAATDKPARQFRPGQKLKYPLNSNDALYYDMRHLNCLAIGKFLSQRARELSAFEQSRKNMGNSIPAIREYMKKMTVMQAEKNSVRIFAHVLEKVQASHTTQMHKRVETEQSLICSEDDHIDFIEECILRGDPLEDVLRLLVIQAQTRGGFKQKVAEQLKQEIVQTYGYEALFTLERFEKLGLLCRTQTRPSFPSVVQKLRLMPDGIEEGSLQPQDPACAYSGYAPIISRIAEAVGRLGGWKSIEDTLKALPGGPVFDVEQVPCAKKPPVTLVFVLGGVTYGEVSAMRILSRREGGTHNDYIIATTKMVNAHSLIRSLINKFPDVGD